MDTEKMIRELRAEAEKHKDDKVFTGQTNVSNMCHDAADRLEEQEYLINHMCNAELIHIFSMRNHENWTKSANRCTFRTADGMYWINYANEVTRGEKRGLLFFVSFDTGNTTRIADTLYESVLMNTAFNNALSMYRNRLLVQFHNEKENK